MATRQSRTTVRPPTTASLLRRSRRQASRQRLVVVAADGAAATRSAVSRLVPDAGVDKAINEVNREIHEGQEDTVEEDYGHDHRIITAGHGEDEEAPHPWHAENGLDEEGPGAHGSEERAQERDHRDARVLEHVLKDDRALGQPLGAGGADIVGANHLDHARAREARDD